MPTLNTPHLPSNRIGGGDKYDCDGKSLKIGKGQMAAANG